MPRAICSQFCHIYELSELFQYIALFQLVENLFVGHLSGTRKATWRVFSIIRTFSSCPFPAHPSGKQYEQAPFTFSHRHKETCAQVPCFSPAASNTSSKISSTCTSTLYVTCPLAFWVYSNTCDYKKDNKETRIVHRNNIHNIVWMIYYLPNLSSQQFNEHWIFFLRDFQWYSFSFFRM